MGSIKAKEKLVADARAADSPQKRAVKDSQTNEKKAAKQSRSDKAAVAPPQVPVATRHPNIRPFEMHDDVRGIYRVEHGMFGSNGKARNAVESEYMQGIMAFSMSGDVYLWQRKSLRIASGGPVRKILGNTSIAPGSDMDSGLWSEQHRTAVLGYTLGPAGGPNAQPAKQVS